MSVRKMRRARARALAAGTAISISVAALPAAASADSVVTNNNDSGAGSLRQALAESNAGPDADTITFAASVTGSITVNSELTVNYATKIVGPGTASLTVRAPSSRVFFFYPFAGGDLELEGITVTGTPPGGSTVGAGVDANCAGANAGLVLRNAAITASTTAQRGGGIFSDGCDVSLVGSTISGNTTTGVGAHGGAIFLTDSPGGGTADRLGIVDSVISGNSTGEHGGGVFASEVPAAIEITRSVISDNHTPIGSCRCGGGLYLDDVGPITVDASTIAGNSAGAGGGMFVAGQEEAFAMRNTTVTANSGQGAGLYIENDSEAPFTIANSTIAGNTAGDSEGGGIYFGSFSEGSDLVLSSTIVAGNTGASGPDIHNAASGETLVLVDHSLIGQATGVLRLAESAPGTNKLDTGPIPLGPLTDNGGPTPTMLPQLGGPAIDAGVANSFSTDQRGLIRTVDQPALANGTGSDGTDIGAVELADSEISGAGLKAKKKQKQKGKKVKVVVELSAAEPVTANASGSIKLGKKKLPLTKPSTDLDPGERKKLTLKPKGKRAAKTIVKTLAKGKAAKASVAVTFADPAGNTEQTSIGAKLVD